MDMKRFTEIDGKQGVLKLLDGEKIFNRHGRCFYMELNCLIIDFEGVSKPSNCLFTDVVRETWYVKKPFDVRAEMLARPNEWIAAYNNDCRKWIQVGFDTIGMRPVTAYYGYTGNVEGGKGEIPTPFELETCIPIEDVPQEEL